MNCNDAGASPLLATVSDTYVHRWRNYRTTEWPTDLSTLCKIAVGFLSPFVPPSVS